MSVLPTQITVEGLVATTPRHLVTQTGVPITTFRMADSRLKFDLDTSKWVSDKTNWYTVISFHTLAVNVSQSISKGDRITVTGAIEVVDWHNGDSSGTSIEIEATEVGHALSWGTSTFSRNTLSTSSVPEPSLESLAQPNAE